MLNPHRRIEVRPTARPSPCTCRGLGRCSVEVDVTVVVARSGSTWPAWPAAPATRHCRSAGPRARPTTTTPAAATCSWPEAASATRTPRRRRTPDADDQLPTCTFTRMQTLPHCVYDSLRSQTFNTSTYTLGEVTSQSLYDRHFVGITR